MSAATDSPRQRRLRTRKHRGIALGIWALSPPDRTYYRIRIGRSLALAPVAGLTREWLDVYIHWHEARGRYAESLALRSQWLATDKAVATANRSALAISVETVCDAVLAARGQA